MRILLRDLAPGQDYAIQFRSNDGEGNTSDWSQVQRFTTTNDLLKPGNVTGLSWANSGSSFIGTWNKVTTNADGTTLKDFRDYHCIVSNGTTSVNFYVHSERFEFTQEQNITAFGSVQDGLILTVTARDLTYNESPTPAVVKAEPSNPPTPSTPTVTNYLGLLQVNVDGKDNGGSAMPRNIGYYEIHVGTASGFTTTTSTYNGRVTINPGQKASYVISSALTYGTPVFVRVIAVNSLGNKSTASGTASGTPARISGLDIANGQISPTQINFTAKDIGGANAYYPATTAARDALTGVKSGDVAYVTGSGYATYRYNGTSWDPASEVGVISGTKLLAGTVTSDAVGTNLLITAAANIGTAVIDSGSLSYVDAGKITAGIMQSKATASYGGVTQPAWSLDVNGNAVLNNTTVYGTLTLGKSGASSTNNAAAMVRSYNYVAGSAGWAIKGDGSVEFTSGTFRGSLTTGTGAAGSRYMKVGGTASTGTINFYADDGTNSYLTSYTETTGTESLELGIMGTGNTNFWNTLHLNSSMWTTFKANKLDLSYSSNSGDYFILRQSSDKGATNNVTRMFFSDTDSYIRDGSGNLRFRVFGTDTFFNVPNHTATRLVIRRPEDTDTGAYSNPSPGLQFVNDNNFGGVFRYLANSTGGSNRFECNGSSGGGSFVPIYASDFTVQSTGDSKTDIQDIQFSATDKIKSAKVKAWRRPGHKSVDGKKQAPDGPLRYGWIAEEAPPEVQVREEDGSLFGLSVTSQVGLLIATIQELEARLSALENKKSKP